MLGALTASASSCAVAPEEPLSMRVRWGLTGASTLPTDVTDVEIVTCVQPRQGAETCGSFTCSVNALSLETENDVPTCRPRLGTEMYGNDPVLVRTGLPIDEALRFELRGKGAAGELLYVGHAGPFVLTDGERRFVDLTMYEVARSASIPGVEVSRFLHTATPLPDGRVLVAGGFDRAQRLAECPAEPALPEGSRCFELQATDEALAFDPSSGTVTPIRAAMIAARAGHTATALPDGRVLLAGGAPRALLAMVPQGEAAVGGYAMTVVPQRTDGSPGALDHFEVFDAFLDGQEDPERDGDLGRGRFLGAIGQSAPGPLNAPRFLHAAAVVPSNPSRVLLVGGLGGAESAATYEVFDADRTGGYGVYVGRNLLTIPRPAPGAIGLGDRVWIFGGAPAAGNADLAEVWMGSATDPNGAVTVATELGQFPSSAAGVAEDHPEYAFLRPLVASVNEGTRALVLGWYGPVCDPGASTPRFSDPALPGELCNSPGTTGTRSFTVNGASGLATSTMARPRAMGALAESGCFQPNRDERYLFATGGATNTSWVSQNNIDVFDGLVDGSGAASRRTTPSLGLASPRLMHTSTGLPGLGVVSVGGITFTPSLDQVLFQRSVEVVFFPRPDEEC